MAYDEYINRLSRLSRTRGIGGGRASSVVDSQEGTDFVNATRGGALLGVGRPVVRQAVNGGNNPFSQPSVFPLPANPALHPNIPGSVMEPSLGRGFRLGNFQTVAAGTTELIANFGVADRWTHWKISLAVKMPQGVANPTQGRGLLFRVLNKIENEDIPRDILINWGQSGYMYAAGRSLQILAINLESAGFDFVAHFGIEESSPGLPRWTTSSTFTGLVAETALVIPPFATHFQALSPNGNGPRIRGYGAGGTLLYNHVIAAPLSELIPVVPRLHYTITSGTGAAEDHIVNFNCVG